MNSLEPTKLALVRILQILEQYSDFDHPLKQQDIIEYLDKDYGIAIERKAVGRNLSLLKEAGYDIASDRRGSYLAERTFDDSELRMLIDGVLASRHITAKHSKELIERLCSLSNKYFRSHVKDGQPGAVLQYRDRRCSDREEEADCVLLQQVWRRQKTAQDERPACNALPDDFAQSAVLSDRLQRKVEKFRALPPRPHYRHSLDG